ncbi:MAG: septation ring formation regulator EzrA [Bacilli bacterium]
MSLNSSVLLAELTPIEWTLIIVGILVVLSVGFVISMIKTKKHRFQRHYQQLEQDFLRVQSIPVVAKLGRIERIAQNNVVYAQVHQEYRSIYEQRAFSLSEEIQRELEQAKAELKALNYKGLPDNFRNLQIKIQSYEEQMNLLDNQLKEFTKDEDNVRSLESSIKEQYRQCMDYEKIHANELGMFQENLIAIKSQIDAKFTLYEEHLRKGNFSDGRDLLLLIQKDVAFYDSTLTILPKMADKVTRDLPDRINRVIDHYNEMVRNEYPLYHILASNLISNAREQLADMVGALANFKYDGIEERVLELERRVDGLQQELNSEAEARAFFDRESQEIYRHAEELQRNYVKSLREFEELGKVYTITPELTEKEQRITNEVNQLATIRRVLDGLNYGKQPYSNRAQKLRELDNQSKQVEASIEVYRKHIFNMRDHSEEAFVLSEKASAHLRRLQITVRNVRLESLILKYEDDFENGYAMVERLNQLIAKSPIKVDQVSVIVQELNALINRLEKDTNSDILSSQKAEKMIQYANIFRTSFSDVARNIVRAEMLFFEGDYTEAYEIAESSVSRFGADGESA